MDDTAAVKQAGDETPSENGEISTNHLQESSLKRQRSEEESQAAEEEESPSEKDCPAPKRTKTDNEEPSGQTESLSNEVKAENGTKIAANIKQEQGESNSEGQGPNAPTVPEPSTSSALTSVASPALTRRRASAKAARNANGEAPVVSSNVENGDDAPKGAYGTRINNDRWIVHEITEDYVDFVGRMMYPGRQFRPYGYDTGNLSYPLDGISALGFLKSPLRRPTIIERWSPYEVALFEAALTHHGKEFHLVAREIGTKNTREVIDFYYTWKKTKHYKKWKEIYISDDMLDIEPLMPVKGRQK